MIVIHAGMPKTGTTALQDGLCANRDALRDAGIDYPVLWGGEYDAHHEIGRRLLDGDTSVIDEVLGYERQAPTLLLSTESLSNLLTRDNRKNLDLFLGALAEVDEVRLVLCLRRMDEFLEAMYLQHVRMGLDTGSPTEYMEPRIGWVEEVIGELARLQTSDSVSQMTMVAQVPGTDTVAEVGAALGVPSGLERSSTARDNRRLGIKATSALANVEHVSKSLGYDVEPAELVEALVHGRIVLDDDRRDLHVIPRDLAAEAFVASMRAAAQRGLSVYRDAYLRDLVDETPHVELDASLLDDSDIARIADGLGFRGRPQVRSRVEPGLIYLDTASVGIPPLAAVEAFKDGIDSWASGSASPPDYDETIDRCRTAFAHIVGCEPDWVAIPTPVSLATAQAKTALSPGDRVLLAEEDFTSVLFPFLADRSIEAVLVPLDELIERIDDDISMVAVSAVQSADGRVLDLDRLADRCAEARAISYLDMTQAAGWLDVDASRFDLTAAGAYKWLTCPRGVGFLTVNPRVAERLEPLAPGWYSGEDPWESTYRPPYRVASGARRFDVSPAWLPFVGAAPTLEALSLIGVAAVGQHDVGLANRFRAGLGLGPDNAPIVGVELEPAQIDRLGRANVRFAARDGRSRFSFHLHNTESDVDLALDAILGT